MDRKIGIVVVSYHNPQGTERYIKQELVRLTYPYTVIVVNVDATIDDSRKLAVACGLTFVNENSTIPQQSNGYLISCEQNLGYARGNNRGIEFLEKIGGFTHYVFSNDDIEFKNPNILTRLADKLDSDDSLGCIGPRIIGLDGHDQSPHTRYVSPYRMIGWNMLAFLRKKKNESVSAVPPKSGTCYWVCGAFMMVKSDAFVQAGMFDDSTFLYFEEVMLAERLLCINKKVYFEADTEIVHYEGGSSGTINKKKQKLLLESQILYYKKYKSVPTWLTLLLRLSFRFKNLFYKEKQK